MEQKNEKKTNLEKKLVLPEDFRTATPSCEQETTINFLRSEELACVYTCDNTMLTKLKRLCAANPQEFEVKRVFYTGGIPSGVEVMFPKKLLSIRPRSRKAKGTGLQDTESEEGTE